MQAHDAEVYMDVVIPWRTSTGGVTVCYIVTLSIVIHYCILTVNREFLLC